MGAVRGHFGVPLVMTSGDEAAVAEAHAFFEPVEAVAVKRGHGRNRAVLYDLDDCHRRIREAAARAMGLAGRAKPFGPPADRGDARLLPHRSSPTRPRAPRASSARARAA